MVVLYIVALYYARNTRFHSGSIRDNNMLSLGVRQPARYNVSASCMSGLKAEYVWNGNTLKRL